jgi:hypothetical protein
VDILDCTTDDKVDALEAPIVERFMKLRLIIVERVDIVERRLSLIVEELEPIVVDKVDKAICVKRKLAEIDEVVIDRFEPFVVEIVESAICVVSKLSPDAVDRVETDNCRVEKLEPATVDKKFTLLSM